MRSPHDDYVRSLHQARKSRRRGDPAEAERWARVAERHLRMASRLSELKAPFLKPLWTPAMTQEEEKNDALEKLNDLLRRMDEETAGAGKAEDTVAQDIGD